MKIVAVANITSIYAAYLKKCSKDRREEMTWHYEINKYVSDPQASSSEDILEWWKRHKSVLPNLSLMTKDFFYQRQQPQLLLKNNFRAPH